MFPASYQNAQSYCITYGLQQSCTSSQQETFTCMVPNLPAYKVTTTVNIFTGGKKHFEMHPHCFLVVFVIYTNWLFISKAFTCSDTQYGKGQEGAISVIGCDPGEEGSMTAVCQSTKWKLISDTCILTIIKQLQTASQVSDQLTVYSRFLLLCRYQLGLLGMLNYFMHHHSNFLCLFVDEY